MKKSLLLATVAAVALSESLQAGATPIIYDFAGTGSICTYLGSGTWDTSCTGAQMFTGTVSFDVLSSTAPYVSLANGEATGQGWVDSNFIINWDGNSFTPNHVPGEVNVGSNAWVWNNSAGSPSYDLLGNEQFFNGIADNLTYQSYASLYRSTLDTSWLTDLTFNTSVGLAPASANTVNSVSFGDWQSTWQSPNGAPQYFGWNGTVKVTSLTPEVAVPEPPIWALLAVGLAGLGIAFSRRRYPEGRGHNLRRLSGTL